MEEKCFDEQNMSSCSCGSAGATTHTCPFQEDVNNDSEFTCNCCEECQEQCAMDI